MLPLAPPCTVCTRLCLLVLPLCGGCEGIPASVAFRGAHRAPAASSSSIRQQNPVGIVLCLWLTLWRAERAPFPPFYPPPFSVHLHSRRQPRLAMTQIICCSSFRLFCVCRLASRRCEVGLLLLVLLHHESLCFVRFRTSPPPASSCISSK